GASGENQVIREIIPPVRHDMNSSAFGFPLEKRFFEVQLCPLARGQSQVRLNASFGKKNPGPRFPHRPHIVVWLKRGKAAADFAGSQDFMSEGMLFSTAARAAEYDSFGRADH